MVSDADWAYLAGIIDGEGCILIKNRVGGYPPATIICSIASTSPKLIEWLSNRFGGSISVVKHRAHKTLYHIYWQGYKAEPILTGALPYLVVKEDQAGIALAFRKLVGMRGVRVSPDNARARGVLSEAMNILNQSRKSNK